MGNDRKMRSCDTVPVQRGSPTGRESRVAFEDRDERVQFCATTVHVTGGDGAGHWRRLALGTGLMH